MTYPTREDHNPHRALWVSSLIPGGGELIAVGRHACSGSDLAGERA